MRYMHFKRYKAQALNLLEIQLLLLTNSILMQG
jgi:hypothetical protein